MRMIDVPDGTSETCPAANLDQVDVHPLISPNAGANVGGENNLSKRFTA